MRIKKWQNLVIFGLAVLVGGGMFFGLNLLVRAGSSFEEIRDTYHQEMNDFFNKKIEELDVLIEKDNFENNPNFLAPENPEDCNEENVSGYCVSMEALDRYLKYAQKLKDNDVFNDFAGEDLEQAVLNRRIDNYRYTASDEIEKSRQVMEQAVAAYNEYRLAYPMHIKYQSVISELNNYRLELRDLRRDVESFPAKFIDATSTQCQ